MALIVTKLLGVVRPGRAAPWARRTPSSSPSCAASCATWTSRVDVVAVPTVREPDGLAMSSRNAYLTAAQRAAAPNLYAALMAGAAAGARPHATAKDVVVAAASTLLMTGPLPGDERPGRPARRGARRPTRSFDLDYLAIVDPDTFEPRATVAPGSLLIAAARLGAVRLIDNVSLTPSAYPAEDATT